ncbi:MAG: SGNH/GDSL hydrolase family protein [Cyclobacteriaceae bacterium]
MNVLHCILLFLFNCAALIVVAQGNDEEKKATLTYYGRGFFLLEGSVIADSLKESPYDRLPLSYKEKVREPVWNLSKSSAGISVRFLSNSSSIHVKWTVLHDHEMNHMAETGIKGIDLYWKNDGHWQYVNTGRPTGKENEALLIENMTKEMREYKMFLPLYDGVTKLEVGIDSTSVIKKPVANQEKPIVFYGTSITQGGCASRPGMVHTNIISRKLDADCINFGFSGNGKMETPIVELISDIDARFYVIECLPNMSLEEVQERTIPLVEVIREKHPATPIIFVENLLYEKTSLDKDIESLVNSKNAALENAYNTMLDDGIENLLYINNHNALGTDHEGTVDGVHFTDLGFLRYADYLIAHFEQFDLVQTAD